MTPRHIFLCASPSANLHRNPNRAEGSLGVQKLPECHCIINAFDNNTFIFILVSFHMSLYCGDYCQIVNSSGCVGFLQDSSHSWQNMDIRLVCVCVCVLACFYLLHTGYRNAHSMSKVSTFSQIFTSSNSYLRVKLVFRVGLDLDYG